MLRFRFCFVIVFVNSQTSRFLCWHMFLLNVLISLILIVRRLCIPVNSLWQNYQSRLFYFQIILKKHKRSNNEEK